MPADDDTDDLPEQVRVRRGKYDRLVAAGAEPYPLGYPRTATLAEVRERFSDLETDSASGQTVSVAGRVVLYRAGGNRIPEIKEVQLLLDSLAADPLAVTYMPADSAARRPGVKILGDL